MRNYLRTAPDRVIDRADDRCQGAVRVEYVSLVKL